MGKLIIIGLITAILALTALYAFDPSYRAQRADAALYASQREQLAVSTKATQTALDLQQQQINAQIDTQRSQQLAPVTTGLTIWTFVLVGLAMGAAVVLTAGFCVVLLARRAVLVRPDAQGMLPMPLVGFTRLADTASAALGGFHLARVENARHQAGQTPHSITYSPDFTRSITTESTRFPDGSTLDATSVLGAGVLSFAELLSAGTIGKGRPILIGYDEQGTPVEASWQQLYSAGVGGLQGSGKTWSVVNILAQSVLNNARLVICDLHAGDPESLATRLAPLERAYLFEVADSPQATVQAVKRVDERLTARKGGDSSRSVIVLVIDEYTSTIRRLGAESEAVADLIANLTSEGRKYGIFVMLLAQNWSTESTGGSQVRNTLASALIHRTRASEARMLTGMTAADLPGDTLQLAPGQFYLLDTRGDLTKVTAPRIAVDDVQRVAGLLVDNHTTLEHLINEPINDPSTGHQSKDMAAQSTKPLTHQEALILSLVRQRKGMAEIVKAVWGADGGPKYKERAAEVMRIIAEQLEVRAA